MNRLFNLNRSAVSGIFRRHFTTASSSSSQNQSKSAWEKFWAWTSREQPDYPRWSREWVQEGVLACVIFGIAGTTTVKMVRPSLKQIGLEGSMKEGPWSYRIGSVLAITPIYTLILLTIGTVCGRHHRFAIVAMRMWGRLLPKSVSNKILCKQAVKKREALQTP